MTEDRRRTAPYRARGEDGISLVVALIFVAVVGTVAAALLPYVKTGVGEAAVARSVRTVQNGADAALEAAVENIRYSSTLGTSAATCPTYTPPAFPAPIGSPLDFSVTCTSLSSTASNGPDDQPLFALHTLDTTSGSSGIQFAGNSLVTVDGGIFSNNDIEDKSNGRAGIQVYGGDVFAKGSCSNANITATGVKHCPTVPGDPSGADPNYPSRFASLLAADPAWMTSNADPLGTCTSNTSIVKFLPGYYSQPPTPDPSATAGTGCKNNPQSVWWFSPGSDPDNPGVYYFDFPDKAINGATTNAAATWTIKQAPGSGAAPDMILIGGSLPSGWNASTTAAIVQASTAGTRCSTTGPGVQWVVGGATNIYVTGNGSSGADLELCGSATKDPDSKQQIAFYGLKTGAARSLAGAPARNIDPNTATTSGSPSFSNATDGRVNGETSASVTISDRDTAQSSKSSSIEMSGYTIPTAVQGAVIVSAKLRIWHKETGQATPKLKVTFNSGTSVTNPSGFSSSNSLGSQDIDLLTALGADDPVPWRALQNLKAQYTVDVREDKSGSGEIDGVQLRLTYVPAAAEATRCATGGTPCDALTNDKSATIFARGTGYTPAAKMTLEIFNQGGLIFNRGLIAKSLFLNLNGTSKKWDRSPFGLPGSNTFREVLFTVTQQLAGGGTKDVLKARVLFDDSVSDGSGKKVLSPGARVKIKKWTVLR